MDLAESLGIKREFAVNMATAYEGYARLMLSESVVSESWRVTGSSPNAVYDGHMGRAANYWLIVDSDRARKCYRRVSDLTRDFLRLQIELSSIGSRREGVAEARFALVSLALSNLKYDLLAGRSPNVSALRLLLRVVDDNPHPSILAVLATCVYLFREDLEGHGLSLLDGGWKEESERYAGVEFGELGITLNMFLRAADFGIHDSLNLDKASNWLHDLGALISPRIAVARSSGYHWERLYSRLLPFDPEVLWLMAAFMRFLKRRRVSDEKVPIAEILGVHNIDVRIFIQAANSLNGE